MPRHQTTLNPTLVIEMAASIADEVASIDNLTLAQVAERLNVRVPSLYNHVDGLNGLRRGVTLLCLREMAEVMRDAAFGASGGAAIMAAASALRDYALRHPGRYTAAVRAQNDDEEIRAAGGQIINLFVRLLEPYQLQQDDLIHTVRGLRSLVHGFVALECAGGFGIPLDTEQSFRRLVQTFLAGLDHKEG